MADESGSRPPPAYPDERAELESQPPDDASLAGGGGFGGSSLSGLSHISKPTVGGGGRGGVGLPAPSGAAAAAATAAGMEAAGSDGGAQLRYLQRQAALARQEELISEKLAAIETADSESKVRLSRMQDDEEQVDTHALLPLIPTCRVLP